MTYVTSEARQQLLDTVAEAIDQLALALAALGAAYEQLDDFNADRLEEELFRPVQAAYGRAQRTHSEFAARHGLPTRRFAAASAGLPSQGAKVLLERAVEAAGEADFILSELQDSMMPVEVGDADLRAGLEEVRGVVGGIGERAREVVRTLGR
jgi:hypothetical protein